MKPYAILYSSKTGNTKKVAEAMIEGREDAFDLWDVKEKPVLDEYECIFMGYWVDQGAPDMSAKKVMATIRNKPVALFYTLGAEKEGPHAMTCAANGGASLGAGCKVLGVFNSQGAIDPVVIEMMKKLPLGGPHAATAENIARWASAAEHPNEEDLDAAKAFVQKIVTVYENFYKIIP